MSHTGKMLRGKKLYSNRDLNGKLPFEISRDTHKMKEINYFLEHSKTTTKPKTEKSVNKK